MKKTLLITALAVVSVFTFSGCGFTYTTLTPNEKLVNVQRVSILRSPKETFNGLSKGLITYVQSQSSDDDTEKFFSSPTVNYVRSMGFKEISSNSDYKLILSVGDDYIDVNDIYNIYISIDVFLKDEKGTELFCQKGVSASSQYKKFDNFDIFQAIGEAYTKALEQINWNRIASFLRTEQLPKDEPQKQVQGYGDTALEQTIIRWDVQSRPQGADIFWRVVSKTPDVKSTNNKYLMTTPYEATKALDIKGLTYQTSGNVRIILRCEKDGYMPQEKEYDVRMVLDQEEISAFFRLVKEE